MPKRRIIVIQNDEAWNNYLIEAFEDTPSTPEIIHTTQDALPIIRQGKPDVVFINPKLCNKPLEVALQANRQSNREFRLFRLGKSSETSALCPFDDGFDEVPQSLHDFHKKLIQHLILPDPIRMLVVDDDPEVGEVFRDYFDHRKDPGFMVETAQDGNEAEEKLGKDSPHVLILDLKMPERDGRELFRDLKKQEKLPPTIVFFDAVSADEVLEIRKWGSPAFVEKGSQSSSMPVMSALIKKVIYFS